MARLYLTDKRHLAVWGSFMDDQSPPAEWVRLAFYDEEKHLALHQKLSDNCKNAMWNNANRQLSIDGIVVLDGNWIDAQENEVIEKIRQQEHDRKELTELLEQVDLIIDQLESDRDSWASITTIALLRPVIFKMLIALIRSLKVERAILRNGLEV